MSIVVLIVACNPNPAVKSEKADGNSVSQMLELPEFSVNDLNSEDKARLEKSLPSEIKNFFVGSRELKVRVFEQERTISDERIKVRILNAIFLDIARTPPLKKYEAQPACKESGYSVSAEKLNKDLLTDYVGFQMSYGCGYLDISSTIDNIKKSKTVRFDPVDPLSKNLLDMLVKHPKNSVR